MQDYVMPMQMNVLGQSRGGRAWLVTRLQLAEVAP